MSETLLPLSAVKIHLRVDDDHEDGNIALYRDAAVARAEAFLNARLVADAAAVTQAGDLPVNPAVMAACLLLTADLYERREGGADGRGDELPQGFYALLHPYRRGMGV